MTSDFSQAILWGALRGACVHSLIYPLDVIKTNLQIRPGATTYTTALELLRNQRLYSGFSSQILQTTLKQTWCWPIICFLPAYFKEQSFHLVSQNILTGLVIASLDAAILTPLEKRKIASMTKTTLHQNKTMAAHFAKLSVSWCTFLTVQALFRSQYDRKPTPLELAVIGVKTAFIVSAAAAPFDVLNTYKQSGIDFYSGNKARSLFRGWHLRALSLTIHSVASVFVMEKLKKLSPS